MRDEPTRTLAYLLMLGLLFTAVATGTLWIALWVGGAKTLIVGLEYMELRHAARPHAVVFVIGAVALTGLLVVLT